LKITINHYFNRECDYQPLDFGRANEDFRKLNWRYLAYSKASGTDCVREYHHKIWPYMVQDLHFRFLKFPLTAKLNVQSKCTPDMGISPHKFAV
jgi:hypothetical protein